MSEPVKPALRRSNGTFGKGPVVHPEDMAAKFWAKVQKSVGCWKWLGKTNPRHKYGEFYVGWDGKRYAHWRAHRLAYRLTHGPFPVEMQVMHTCDNRLCVNPLHLQLGTASDNMSDAAKKERLPWQKWKKAAEMLEGLFRWEDVDLIRQVAYATAQRQLRVVTPEGYHAMLDLADRIEALLRPRKDKPFKYDELETETLDIRNVRPILLTEPESRKDGE